MSGAWIGSIFVFLMIWVCASFRLGYWLAGRKQRAAIEVAKAELEEKLEESERARLRRIAETKRFTAARPGTSPARVVRANMQRGTGHMHRTGIDETGESTN